jgi:SAM-dependent methyltransferase
MTVVTKRGDETGLAARFRELRTEAIQLGLVPTAIDDSGAEPDAAALHEAKAGAARVKGLQVAQDVVAVLKRSGALGVRTSGTFSSLFDLGCGDGGTTGPLAAALKVPRQRCLGLDYEFKFNPQKPNLSMGALVSDAFCFALYSSENPAPARPCTFDIRFPPVEQARGGGGGGAGGAAAVGEAVDFDDELLGEANPLTPHYPKHVRDDAFDLITTLHVLHHIPAESRNVVLTEVARTLKKGGLFLVKEHDVPDESFAHFLDAVHVYKQKIVYPGGEEQDMPFTKFQSRAKWINIIEAKGLVLIHSEYEPDAFLRDIVSFPSHPFHARP